MVSQSFIGRVLFGSYFSGWKMLRGSFKDPTYKEEFTSKFAGFLKISEGLGQQIQQNRISILASSPRFPTEYVILWCVANFC
ncbi:hypothetical protein RDI58_003729 [Solanum bulbocastanum]|uniref:Uncharacterized protein n=1 Tax=Solanum bulbocastanum TaxID=147425 RepID=A0AAN8U8W6_SOLBU